MYFFREPACSRKTRTRHSLVHIFYHHPPRTLLAKFPPCPPSAAFLRTAHEPQSTASPATRTRPTARPTSRPATWTSRTPRVANRPVSANPASGPPPTGKPPTAPATCSTGWSTSAACWRRSSRRLSVRRGQAPPGRPAPLPPALALARQGGGKQESVEQGSGLWLAIRLVKWVKTVVAPSTCNINSSGGIRVPCGRDNRTY